MTALSVRRVASLLVTVVALLLVGAFVVQAVPGVVGADASYVVLSGSMEPTISPGDSVVVKSVDPGDIESGDVITYKRSGESTPVTHRVVEVLDREDGLAFRTAGDANDSPDPQPVPAESVTGEVWFAIPLIGHVVLFANTPTGLGVLVGLPVVAFVVSELYEFVRDEPDPAAADDDVHGDAEGSDAHVAGTDAEETAEVPADAALEDAGQTAATGATGAAVEPTSAPATGVSDTDEASDGIAITSMDLRLSGVAFFALAVYSGYVAYLDLTPLRVGIFAGAAMLVVFVATVFLFGEDVAGSDAAGGNVAQEASTASAEASTASTEAATDGGESGDAMFGGDDDAA